MNPIAHIFFTYSILSFIIPDTRKYLLPIIIFSIIIDIDHIPIYLKKIFTSRESIIKIPYNNTLRMPIQEPIGIIIIEMILLLLYLFGIKHIILLIASLSILIHWLIDFLTVPTCPLYPISTKEITLFYKTKKSRVKLEIILTIISVILFALTI
jgi:hypothetical protein